MPLDLKPLNGNSEYVTVDDQASFLHSFSLAAKLLRIPAKSYAMYQTSDAFLEGIPPVPNSLVAVFVDWNLATSSPHLMYGPLIVLIKEKMPDVGVYVVSTSLDQKEMDEAKSAGANGWIGKSSLIDNLKRFNKEREDRLGEFYVWK